MANQPAVALVHASPDWEVYTGGLFNGSCSGDLADANHAVLVVGWTEDAWIVKNSWCVGSWAAVSSGAVGPWLGWWGRGLWAVVSWWLVVCDGSWACPQTYSHCFATHCSRQHRAHETYARRGPDWGEGGYMRLPQGSGCGVLNKVTYPVFDSGV